MTAYMLTHYEIKAVDDFELKQKLERQARKSGRR